jgi:hypothetical protein
MAIKALKDPADATQDPIIDCTRGRSIQFDAAHKHPCRRGSSRRTRARAYDGQFVARVVTDAPTPYVLLGTRLGELHAQLQSGMEWPDRQPADPAEVPYA